MSDTKNAKAKAKHAKAQTRTAKAKARTAKAKDKGAKAQIKNVRTESRKRRQEQDKRAAHGGLGSVFVRFGIGIALFAWGLMAALDLGAANDWDAAAGRILAAFGGGAIAASGLLRWPNFATPVFGACTGMCALYLANGVSKAHGDEQTIAAAILAVMLIIATAIYLRVLRRAAS